MLVMVIANSGLTIYYQSENVYYKSICEVAIFVVSYAVCTLSSLESKQRFAWNFFAS